MKVIWCTPAEVLSPTTGVLPSGTPSSSTADAGLEERLRIPVRFSTCAAVLDDPAGARRGAGAEASGAAADGGSLVRGGDEGAGGGASLADAAGDGSALVAGTTSDALGLFAGAPDRPTTTRIRSEIPHTVSARIKRS